MDRSRTELRTELRTATIGAALLLMTLTACGQGEAAAIPEPPAGGNVLDLADVLTTSEEQDLSSLIDEHNASTDAARVAVLLVENAGGPIEDYSCDVATSWGVGDEGADNGVLVVADTTERELRIETADGVREQFSDDDAGGRRGDPVGRAVEPGPAAHRGAASRVPYVPLGSPRRGRHPQPDHLVAPVHRQSRALFQW